MYSAPPPASPTSKVENHARTPSYRTLFMLHVDPLPISPPSTLIFGVRGLTYLSVFQRTHTHTSCKHRYHAVEPYKHHGDIHTQYSQHIQIKQHTPCGQLHHTHHDNMKQASERASEHALTTLAQHGTRPQGLLIGADAMRDGDVVL